MHGLVAKHAQPLQKGVQRHLNAGLASSQVATSLKPLDRSISQSGSLHFTTPTRRTPAVHARTCRLGEPGPDGLIRPRLICTGPDLPFARFVGAAAAAPGGAATSGTAAAGRHAGVGPRGAAAAGAGDDADSAGVDAQQEQQGPDTHSRLYVMDALHARQLATSDQAGALAAMFKVRVCVCVASCEE